MIKETRTSLCLVGAAYRVQQRFVAKDHELTQTGTLKYVNREEAICGHLPCHLIIFYGVLTRRTSYIFYWQTSGEIFVGTNTSFFKDIGSESGKNFILAIYYNETIKDLSQPRSANSALLAKV